MKKITKRRHSDPGINKDSKLSRLSPFQQGEDTVDRAIFKTHTQGISLQTASSSTMLKTLPEQASTSTTPASTSIQVENKSTDIVLPEILAMKQAYLKQEQEKEKERLTEDMEKIAQLLRYTSGQLCDVTAKSIKQRWGHYNTEKTRKEAMKDIMASLINILRSLRAQKITGLRKEIAAQKEAFKNTIKTMQHTETSLTMTTRTSQSMTKQARIAMQVLKAEAESENCFIDLLNSLNETLLGVTDMKDLDKIRMETTEQLESEIEIYKTWVIEMLQEKHKGEEKSLLLDHSPLP